jgi:hypothetical protein
MSFLATPLVGFGAGGVYQPSRSLQFVSASSMYGSFTGGAGNRKTYTLSMWVKRSSAPGTAMVLWCIGPISTDYAMLRFNADNTLEHFRVIGSVIDSQKLSSSTYTSTTTWMHILFAQDAANTISRLYVNGAEVSYGASDNPSNINGPEGTANQQGLGYYVGFPGTQHFNGFMADLVYIDGQALTPDALYSGGYPLNPSGLTPGATGYWLPFSNNASTTTMAEDGYGPNDWTLTNFTTTQSSTDVPP